MEDKSYQWGNAELGGEDSGILSRQMPRALASYSNTQTKATDGFEFNTCDLPPIKIGLRTICG